MERKGLVLKNTLEVILAVLAVGLLVFAGVKLWGSFVSNESENAQSLADEIKERIEAIGDGERGEMTIQGIGSGWILTGWSKDDPERPEKCFFESCVFVCDVGAEGIEKLSDEATKPEPSWREMARVCDEKGFIREIEGMGLEVSSNVVRDTFSSEAGSESVPIGSRPEPKVFEVPFISIEFGLVRVEIVKNGGNVAIRELEDAE